MTHREKGKGKRGTRNETKRHTHARYDDDATANTGTATNGRKDRRDDHDDDDDDESRCGGE